MSSESSATETAHDLASIFALWIATLKQCRSDFLKHVHSDKRPPTLARAGAHTIHILKADGSEDLVLPTATPDRPTVRSADIISNAYDLCLQIPEENVLRSTIAMPQAGQRALRQALRYELSSVSPLDYDDVYFDFQTRASGLSGVKVDVDLRIVAKSLVDNAARICHENGYLISEIAIGGDAVPADWLAFPHDRSAIARRLWNRFSLLILTALALGLLIFFVALSYSRAISVTELVESGRDQAVPMARAVEKINKRIDTVATATRFLSRKKQQPMLVENLAELSQILPDNTWLDEIEIHGRRVRIRGYSAQASSLISTIDRSGRFADAEFTAPVTTDASHHSERFDIAFDVQGNAR